MRNNKIKRITLKILMCFILSLSTIVFAENNNEENTNDEYMGVFKLDEEKSSIKNGDIDIPTDINIKLIFTKNVSYGEEIIEANKPCISIVDENEKTIDVDIEIKDSSLSENEEYKNYVFVKTIEALDNSKKYTIKISEDLQTNEDYLEKQLPLSINFTTVAKEEPEIPEEENVIDKNTLIEKIKEAFLLKYNIQLEEIEKNKVIIIISDKEGNVINKYTYIGTIEEVKEIIKKIEEEINKPENPDLKPDPEPEKPKPEKPKPDPNPDKVPGIEQDEEDNDGVGEEDTNEDNGYDDEIEQETNEENESEEDSSYEFNDNLGIALVICIFIGFSMYMIYFS